MTNTEANTETNIAFEEIKGDVKAFLDIINKHIDYHIPMQFFCASMTQIGHNFLSKTNDIVKKKNVTTTDISKLFEDTLKEHLKKYHSHSDNRSDNE